MIKLGNKGKIEPKILDCYPTTVKQEELKAINLVLQFNHNSPIYVFLKNVK